MSHTLLDWHYMHARYDQGVSGDWKAPSARGESPWLEIYGQDTETWRSNLTVDKDVVTITAWFVLRRADFPSTGRVFRSAPVADFNGVVQAHGKSSDCFLFFCDYPTARVFVTGNQEIRSGRTFHSGSRTDLLVKVTNRVGSEVVSPSRFYFRPKDFVLSRGHNLWIRVDFRVRTYLKGHAEADFDHFQHDPLRIRLPEWQIVRID